MKDFFTIVGAASVAGLIVVVLGAVLLTTVFNVELVPTSRPSPPAPEPAEQPVPEPPAEEAGLSDELGEPEDDPLAEETGGELTCDYVLADSINGQDRFVAGGELENPSGERVTFRVSAKWTRLGEDPATISKRVSVPASSRRDVQLRVPASTEDISAHQSADDDCDANAKPVRR